MPKKLEQEHMVIEDPKMGDENVGGGFDRYGQPQDYYVLDKATDQDYADAITRMSKLRGHELGEWSFGPNKAWASCKHCNRTVYMYLNNRTASITVTWIKDKCRNDNNNRQG